MENKEYKIAIRYLFLKSLKILSDKNIIDLQINKTNHYYISEIKENTIADIFSQAAFNYELAWYGNFPVNEGQYKSSAKIFDNLYNLAEE